MKHTATFALSAILLACLAACDGGTSSSTCTATCSTESPLSGTLWRNKDSSALSDGVHTGTQEFRTDIFFRTDGVVAETLWTIDHIKTPAPKDSLEGPATPIMDYWHTSHDTLFIGASGAYASYVYSLHGDTLLMDGREGRLLSLRLR